MSNRHKREKFLKVVKQNIIKQEIGEYEKEESPVSYFAVGQDELMAFAEKFVRAKGRFVYCESEKDFKQKLQSLIQYRKWENILAFNDKLNTFKVRKLPPTIIITLTNCSITLEILGTDIILCPCT